MRARPKHHTIGAAPLLASVLLGLASTAAAQPEAVRIDYLAPAGCPDAISFLRSLRGRTTRFRRAEVGEDVRRFSVRVTPAGSAFAGRLEVRNADGSTAVRSLDGPHCDELADALALMTALVIDPDARIGAVKPAATPDDQSSAPAAEEARPSSGPGVTVAVITPPATSKSMLAWGWAAGLQGRTTLGLSPSPAWGGALFVEMEALGLSAFAPTLRLGLGFERSEVDVTSPAGASASFQWLTASLEGCPLRLSDAQLRWGLYPCLMLRLGTLGGHANGISQPKQALGFWSDLGATLRFRVTVAAGLMVEAQGGVLVALTRPSFEILDVVSQSATTTYLPSAFGGTAVIGAAYRFR